MRCLLLGILLAHMPYAHGEQITPPTPVVTVIPIQGMIEPALVYVVRRGLDEAVRTDAQAIIIDMDTPGGAVQAAGEIISQLGYVDIPIYTYVNKGAYSAGAFIALAGGTIYMAPGSVIGAATPMMMSPMGGAQEMPDEVQEKMTSAVAAMVRAAAEQGGHDPQLGEAMVRADIEYRIDGKIISEEGRLLTMTDREAAQRVGRAKKPLLSSGTVESLDALLTQLNLEGATLNYIEVTGAETFARAIAKIAPILMLVGMGGLWLEFKTPGFGLFGLLGALALLLFFFGHHIAGLSGMEDVLFFVLGVLFIGLEIFVTPGFGLLGLSGLFLMLFSFVNAMSERLPGSWKPISIEAETFAQPLLQVAIAFGGSLLLAACAGKYLPKTRLFSSITLQDKIESTPDQLTLVGMQGRTTSDLRPSGTAQFGETKYDVVTRGEYISHDTPVRIAEVHGARIVVESV